MMKKSFTYLELMLTVLLVLPVLAYGYTLMGIDWTYQNDPMQEVFLVNPNCQDPQAGSEEIQILSVLKGADAWNNEGSASFEFHYGGITDKGGGTYYPDGYNVVFWSTAVGGDVIASTYYYSQGDDYIEFDMKYWDGGWIFYGGVGLPDPSSDFDIWDIAAHEFGHCLGLGHTYQFQATMFATSNFRQIKARDLWSDDINGIHAIYGEPDVNVNMAADDTLNIIPPGGGSFDYSVVIKNNTGNARTRVFWIDVVIPNGHTYGPVQGPLTLTIPGGATWNVGGRTQDVPGVAPAGLYHYILKSSTTYGGDIESMTSFPFIKE